MGKENVTAETIVEDILNERVSLKSAIIGVGFAGSYNAQAVSEALNIPAFVINTSAKDLSDSVINKNIPSFLIGNDGRGAGNDRQKSKDMLKVNGKKLFSEIPAFIKLIMEADIIFVVFSSAGGTGSGSGPELVKIIRRMHPEKTCIPLVISPKRFDSPLSQHNNLSCINELDALEGPYVIGDLDKFANDNDDVTYEKMSKWVINTVKHLTGMDMNMSQSGMMDENDLLNLISENGYMAQYSIEVTSKMLENTDVQDLLIKQIATSPAMQIQKDRVVGWGGLVVNLPEDIEDPIKTGNVSKLLAITGEPKHMYKNFSVNQSTKGTVTLILSGMSLPKNRLDESIEKVQQYIEATNKAKRNISLASDLASLGGSEVGGFEGFSTGKKTVQSDVLDEFFG